MRKARSAHAKGELSDADYETFLQEETARAVRWQEEIGLDVLVHGEFERNDMVEYFGEQLDGFAFTKHGWVQSYGSRCVKPPILFGDVSRPKPMTVDWWQLRPVADRQAGEGHADRPGDHPATGPSCATTSRAAQPAARSRWPSATRCSTWSRPAPTMIQIDEAALREGLPLRRADWQAYLDWAVECFRLCASGVRTRPRSTPICAIRSSTTSSTPIAAMDADVISIETSRSKMELLDAFGPFAIRTRSGPASTTSIRRACPTSSEMADLLKHARQRLVRRAALGQSRLRPEDPQLGRGAAGAGQHGRGRAAAARTGLTVRARVTPPPFSLSRSRCAACFARFPDTAICTTPRASSRVVGEEQRTGRGFARLHVRKSSAQTNFASASPIGSSSDFGQRHLRVNFRAPGLSPFGAAPSLV